MPKLNPNLRKKNLALMLVLVGMAVILFVTGLIRVGVHG